MRHALLLLLACTGCIHTLEEDIEPCTVLDEQPVDDDDGQLGFTVTDVVGALHGREWAIGWLDGTEELDTADAAAAAADGDDGLFTGAALTEVRTRFTRTAMPASIRVSADANGEGSCPTAGTFLVAPVDLRVADEAGTFVATARGYVAASALVDAAILVETDDTWLDLEAIPADLAAAGESAARERHPDLTSQEIEASLDGTGAALDLSLAVSGEAPEVRFMLSLARATLTPR